jgi:hypothetical protein
MAAAESRVKAGTPVKKLTMVLVVAMALMSSALALPAGAQVVNDSDLPGPRWPVDGYPPSDSDNAVLKWNEELMQTIRANPAGTGPTIASRAIGVLHTAIFDAWAAYDSAAVGVHSGSSLRRPAAEHTLANKQKAISFAAYTTLVDLFPSRASDYAAQMAEFGYVPSDDTGAAGVGKAAAQAVIAFRHTDGSNQLNGYADTTGYQPVNTWDHITNPWRWQPLCVPLPPPGTIGCPGTVQKPLTPHWGGVASFALDFDPNQFDPPGSSDPVGDTARALTDTSNLGDTQKVKAEYWADGPQSEFPPGHWAMLAQAVSRKRGHSLDDDVKLFFALGNAVMDAGIASWKSKFEFDFVRPTTAIREQYKGKLVTSWLGPYNGYGKVPGEQWRPYQAPNVVTPPFPEYVSGHSAFSAAAHMVLVAFTGSDVFRARTTIKAGTSLFEPRTATQKGTPAKDVVLSWNTFTEAADEAGWSRRWGGIHFQSGDVHGRTAGKTAGYFAWNKAQTYINGTAGG